MASPSGPVRRSSRIASSLAILAEEEALQPVAMEVALQPVAEEVALQPVAEEVALQPVAEEVALQPVAEEVALQQLFFNNKHTRWIIPSNPQWIEIKADIEHQLDTHGFNYGKTNPICAFLRQSLNDGTLSPEIIRELNVMNFEWSSFGAYLIVFAVNVVP